MQQLVVDPQCDELLDDLGRKPLAVAATIGQQIVQVGAARRRVGPHPRHHIGDPRVLTQKGKRLDAARQLRDPAKGDRQRLAGWRLPAAVRHRVIGKQVPRRVQRAILLRIRVRRTRPGLAHRDAVYFSINHRRWFSKNRAGSARNRDRLSLSVTTMDRKILSPAGGRCVR